MTETINIEQVSFEIILHAGNARSSAMEALQVVKQGEYKQADNKMEEAESELHKAHQTQTSLLQKEASGERTTPSVLLVHAQDHLMTAMTLKDMAKEMIDLYKEIRGGKE
ncbi:PTS lactose/cellobiose transporter subunit IIA [Halobacillus shinanisalinarum]|uniref:PTS lactose/cellobiose transporter subunit IIA n=1 Tax=Halobacillus shinanisalinarum TaxID=2932258 RepID=A0ABY4H268_9BACI|nr:PTS lactose/cellobiose transporter subunit IIA [Halobacillus shinanisalinarum]UOQ94542.1 PTS lactose/cellobiose transporter subunit IIA [Halobacillus shinanisalinarum]